MNNELTPDQITHALLVEVVHLLAIVATELKVASCLPDDMMRKLSDTITTCQDTANSLVMKSIPKEQTNDKA